MTGRPPKYDWPALYAEFAVLQKEGLSVKEFAEEKGINYKSVYAGFKALEKKSEKKISDKKKSEKGSRKKKNNSSFNELAFKKDFLEGDYKSLQDFFRQKGIKFSGAIQKKTAGWSQDKKQLKKHAQALAVEKIAENKALDIVHETYSGYYGVMNMLKKALEASETLDIEDSKALKAFTSSANEIRNGFKELAPLVLKLMSQEQISGLYSDLKSGDKSILEVCLIFEEMGIPLPETLQIELKKQQLEQEADDVAVFSDEELDAEFDATITDIERERLDWVPQREKEVAGMKEKLRVDHEKLGRPVETEEDA